VNAEALQTVALAVAAETSVDRVLTQIVDGLVAQTAVALARVWLIGAGDICETCPMRTECPDQTRCLHLSASAGVPLEGGADWTRLDGAFRRFPIGVRKIGRIGATGDGIFIEDVARDHDWIAHPDWLRRERIISFGGQPLVFNGEILGVLGVFSRDSCNPRTFAWLRTFADHAAIAIAHARALKRIEQLKEQLELENDYLREDVRRDAPDGIIGNSPALRNVIEQVAIVAPTAATVLIQGESGTGKELVARALHDRSPRRRRALISVNCASIPRELFESEFFGHVKGAFTGALRDRAGRFQAADGGTLFLDEVGEIPLELQGKLLRVLQEGRFESVGDETTRRVDVRVIAATNRDLQQDVVSDRFRRDLFYRLSVFPIFLPPLRERADDIPSLATHFLEQAAQRYGRRGLRLTERAMRTLEGYTWPGNIRELQHVIERAVLLSRSGVVRLDGVLVEPAETTRAKSAPATAMATVIPEIEWRRREEENLRAALQLAKGRIHGPDGAADILGVKPTTLISRLKALGLRDPRKRPRRRQNP
jgi:transcriptional regulator with GAF, ATPase, and Fis domain